MAFNDPTGFVPTNASGLWGWWDMSSIDPVPFSGGVGYVEDRSRYTRHMRQTIPAYQPVYAETAILDHLGRDANGLPAIFIDDFDKYMPLDYSLYLIDGGNDSMFFSIWFVLNMAAMTGPSTLQDYNTSYLYSSTGFQLYTHNSNPVFGTENPKEHYGFTPNGHSIVGVDAPEDKDVATRFVDEWAILSFHFTPPSEGGTLCEVYKDGSLVTPTDTLGGWIESPRMDWQDVFFNFWWDQAAQINRFGAKGYYTEVLVYNNSKPTFPGGMDLDDRQYLEGYLAHKYDLTDKLPAHPWKDQEPPLRPIPEPTSVAIELPASGLITIDPTGFPYPHQSGTFLPRDFGTPRSVIPVPHAMSVSPSGDLLVIERDKGQPSDNLIHWDRANDTWSSLERMDVGSGEYGGVSVIGPSYVSHTEDSSAMFVWMKSSDSAPDIGGIASVHSRFISPELSISTTEDQVLFNEFDYFVENMVANPFQCSPQRSLINLGSGNYRFFYGSYTDVTPYDLGIVNKICYIDYDSDTQSWGPMGFDVNNTGTYNLLGTALEIDRTSYDDNFSFSIEARIYGFSVSKLPGSNTYHFAMALPDLEQFDGAGPVGQTYYFPWTDGDPPIIAVTGVQTFLLEGPGLEIYSSGLGSSSEDIWETIWLESQADGSENFDQVMPDPINDTRIYIAGARAIRKRGGVDYRRDPGFTNWGGAGVAMFWERAEESGAWSDTELTLVGEDMSYGADLYVSCSGDCFVLAAFDDQADSTGIWQLNLWAKPRGMLMDVVAPELLEFTNNNDLVPFSVSETTRGPIGYAYANAWNPAFYSDQFVDNPDNAAILQLSRSTIPITWYDERVDGGSPDRAYHIAYVTTSGCFLFSPPDEPDIPPEEEELPSGVAAPIPLRPIAYIPRERKRYPPSSIHFIDTMDALYLEMSTVIGSADRFGQVLTSGSVVVIDSNMDKFANAQFRNTDTPLNEFQPSVFGLNSKPVSNEGVSFVDVEDSEMRLITTTGGKG